MRLGNYGGLPNIPHCHRPRISRPRPLLATWSGRRLRDLRLTTGSCRYSARLPPTTRAVGAVRSQPRRTEPHRVGRPKHSRGSTSVSATPRRQRSRAKPAKAHIVGTATFPAVGIARQPAPRDRRRGGSSETAHPREQPRIRRPPRSRGDACSTPTRRRATGRRRSLKRDARDVSANPTTARHRPRSATARRDRQLPHDRHRPLVPWGPRGRGGDRARVDPDRDGAATTTRPRSSRPSAARADSSPPSSPGRRASPWPSA